MLDRQRVTRRPRSGRRHPATRRPRWSRRYPAIPPRSKRIDIAGFNRGHHHRHGRIYAGQAFEDVAVSKFDDLQEQWKQPWSSEGINAAFDVARKKLHDMRTDVAKGAIASAAETAPWSKTKMKTAGSPFAEAMSLGSKEAASTILRTRAGIGGDKNAELAKNSAKQTELQERMASALESLADNMGEDIEVLGGL
jgi:hypothetical protein